MTAKDILSLPAVKESHPQAIVDGDAPLFDVIHLLLDNPSRELGVVKDGAFIGTITQASLLEGVGRMIAPRDDCSVITLECSPEEYSASVISHAIEDSDAHLVDLLTYPAEEGRISVTLRVRHADPASAVRNLERYGFSVSEAHAAPSVPEFGFSREQLLSLQALMNV